MLVLTRKLGERIRINGDTVVEVSRISSGEVRLCFDAPRTVRIDREEVHQQRLKTLPAA